MQQNEKSSCGVNGCGMGCKHGRMMMWVLLVVVAVAGYVFFVRDNDASKKTEPAVVATKDTVKKESEAVVQKTAQAVGSYEVYDAAKLAKAQEGKVVLFFRATWCPSCKALDADIRSHMKDIPENVTILDVDYDKYTDLKKKYGITMQHTLVQVDAQGNQLQKWSASPTLADMMGHLQ